MKIDVKLLVKFLLVSGVFLTLIYSQSLRYPLLNGWDDPEYVTLNSHIRSLDLPHLKSIFFSFSMGNYAPIHILSYALDFRLFGPGQMGHRATNLLIHFLNSILVFLFIRKINRNEGLALVGGLLFAIHPLQVESVAWVSQRKNVLSALFLFLAFLSYTRFSEKGRIPSYGLSVLFFALGLLTKISIVVFPAYIYAYDTFILERNFRWKTSFKYLPFLILAMAAGLITVQAQSVGGIRLEYYGDSWIKSVLLVPTLWWNYLHQILLPLKLSPLYDEKIVASFSLLKLFAMLLFLAAVIFLIFWWGRRKQTISLFWFIWFIVGLMPVSHFIPMVTIMNDRYLYFPMVGIFVILAAIVNNLLLALRPVNRKAVSILLVLLIISPLVLLAQERTRVWADDFTLWSDAVAKFPKQAKARSNLAVTFMDEGEYGRAIPELERALEVDPDLYVGRLNLGACYLQMNNPRSAVEELQKAIRIFGGDPKAHYYLGMAYHLSGKNEQAIPELRWVVDRFPSWNEVTLNLIRICQESGRKEEAEELIRAVRARQQNNINIPVDPEKPGTRLQGE